MFKWKKMSQCRSNQAYRRKNQERGRLVYFLFLHTLLFPHSLMNYMTSLSVLLPRRNNSKLVLCFRWILVHSLLFFPSAFFLENSVFIALECQKGVFRSIWFHWLRGEKKRSLQMVDITSFILYNRRYHYHYFVVTGILQLYTFSPCLTLSTFLHSLYGDSNLHFI